MKFDPLSERSSAGGPYTKYQFVKNAFYTAMAVIDRIGTALVCFEKRSKIKSMYLWLLDERGRGTRKSIAKLSSGFEAGNNRMGAA